MMMKDKLFHYSEDGDISTHKDALLAFSESARIFIHYLSATYAISLAERMVGRKRVCERERKMRQKRKESWKLSNLRMVKELRANEMKATAFVMTERGGYIS
ncbi:hypothetical protein Lal_00034531 [Lupinus albus]|nr:hypothetical protein Lal_00034531 [Lupinus albus]